MIDNFSRHIANMWCVHFKKSLQKQVERVCDPKPGGAVDDDKAEKVNAFTPRGSYLCLIFLIVPSAP